MFPRSNGRVVAFSETDSLPKRLPTIRCDGKTVTILAKSLAFAMNPDLEKRIQQAIANPQNMGELANADVIGTVGNPDCGEMLRMWLKFKDVNGRKVIDQATFQSFGCETAIAVASLATELIRGKTTDEALALKTNELAGELGPLPPMKIHCAQLVESALRSALNPNPTPSPAAPTSSGPTLLEKFTKTTPGPKIIFKDEGPRR